MHPCGNVKQTPYKPGNNAHLHKQDASGIKLNDRGNISTDPNATHIGLPNPANLPKVRGRPHGSYFMAFEFIAPITTQNLPFVALAERLQSEGLCGTESVTPAEVRFRWPESQRQENWPEDAELSRIENGLLLAIHSGTQQQRSQLVENVALIVSELLNQSVEFEEV